MRIKSILLGAGAALLLSAGAAGAATVTSGLNLRSGPGTDYRVIDTLPAGAQVAVLGCSGSWCRVDWNGESGYASASYIAGSGYAGNSGYAEPYYSEYPDYSYDDYPYGYGWGPGVAFGIGGYYGHHRHFRGGHHHHFAARPGFGGTHQRNVMGLGSGPRGVGGPPVRGGMNAMGAAPPATHGTTGMAPSGGNIGAVAPGGAAATPGGAANAPRR